MFTFVPIARRKFIALIMILATVEAKDVGNQSSEIGSKIEIL
jgi:hypothetical protein